MSSSENASGGFDPGYPTNTVFGVVDTLQAVNHAVLAVMEVSIDRENIEIIQSEKAQQQIQDFEDQRPVEARVVKFLVETGEEAEEWNTYNHALSEGHYLIRVSVENREQAEQVSHILRQHGGRFVNYFGPFAVTRLVP